MYNKCTQPLEPRIPCQVAGCRLQVARACLLVGGESKSGSHATGMRYQPAHQMGSSDPSQLHDCCVIRDRSGDTV